jgi:hypothetical protein
VKWNVTHPHNAEWLIIILLHTQTRWEAFMSRKLRLIGPFLLALTLSQTSISVSQEPTEMKLQKWLQKFAQQNSLSEDELNAMLGDHVLGGLCMRKGGLGIVDRETYIVLDDARNAVIVGGKQWDGLTRQQTEVVVTDGHRILGSAPAGEVRDLRVLIFSQNEVHFINPSANSGGIYRRFEK